jgi:hypothetical protein
METFEPEKVILEREASAQELMQKLSQKELILLILNIYSEAEDAAIERLREAYGEEIGEELVRDFFKGVETWMRKHEVKQFHENYCLVTILNARLYRSIHNNLAKSLADLGDIRYAGINDAGTTNDTTITSESQHSDGNGGDVASSGASPSSDDHSQEVSSR